MGKSIHLVPAPQIGEMFMETASRQHAKCTLMTSTFFEIMSNLKIYFHESPQSFTDNICLESKLICCLSETTKSQSQESTGIVDTFLSTNTDF